MTFERRLKPNVMVDLTPLIDVVFQLVIFFMISSTFKTVPGIALNLPNSGTATAISSTELVVLAVSDREVYVNKVKTDAGGAAAVIKSQLEGKDPAQIKANLSAQATVPYQLVVSLLDALRQNGIDSVGLATQNPKAGP